MPLIELLFCGDFLMGDHVYAQKQSAQLAQRILLPLAVGEVIEDFGSPCESNRVTRRSRFMSGLQQSAALTGGTASASGQHALAQLQQMVDAQASVLAFISAFFVLGVIVAFSFLFRSS
jgi:hypothetical protein